MEPLCNIPHPGAPYRILAVCGCLGAELEASFDQAGGESAFKKGLPERIRRGRQEKTKRKEVQGMTDNIRNLLNSVEGLIRNHGTCVLATAGDSEPHCSLMSYVPDPECRRVYMVTLSNTKKFENLIDNVNVSILFDNRTDGPEHVMALTAAGTFERLSPEESSSVRKLLLDRHPQLNELLSDAHAEIFSIRFRSFQLLSGITEQQLMLLE